MDKNKPILIIGHYFYKKGPNMVFGKIFSKNIPYNSNIWNYNAKFISWSFLSGCVYYILYYFFFPALWFYYLYFYFIINKIRKKFIEDDNVSVGEKQTDIDNEEEVKQTSEYIKEFI